MATENFDDVVVPSNPADRKKIKACLRTISDDLHQIEGHKEAIKAEIDAVADAYNLPKKFVRKMAVAYHKDSFDKQVKESESFVDLYESIVLEEQDD